MHERILITGGAGFVGSSLAFAFRKEFPNAGITAFDNLHRRGSELNLPRLAAAGVRFMHGDIRCAEDLEGLPEAPDLIIEASAEPSVLAGYGGSPEYLVQTNLSGCLRCLELARRHKADIIFISTSRIYPVRHLNDLAYEEQETRFTMTDAQPMPGASAEGISENFPLDGARSLYGMTKLAAELAVAEYADAYGLKYVIDRCGLIAGPWQMGKSDQGVVTLWAAAHYFKRPLRYIGFGGSGKQVRDILHVDDLCELICDQVRRLDFYHGRTFNAGGGRTNSLSLREMTAVCEEVTGNRIGVGISAEDRTADVRLYISDHRKLTNFGGWAPTRSPQTVLADIVDWLRAEEELVRPVLLGK
jgi:CDP-paratose 2-epimerase